MKKILLFCVSVFVFPAAFSQIDVQYVDDAPDTVYVQRVAKTGFEGRQVQAWEAQDYAERQMQKRFEWASREVSTPAALPEAPRRHLLRSSRVSAYTKA